jgi:hypothetical protein
VGRRGVTNLVNLKGRTHLISAWDAGTDAMTCRFCMCDRQWQLFPANDHRQNTHTHLPTVHAAMVHAALLSTCSTRLEYDFRNTLLMQNRRQVCQSFPARGTRVGLPHASHANLQYTAPSFHGPVRDYSTRPSHRTRCLST